MSFDNNSYVLILTGYYLLINGGTIFLILWAFKAQKKRTDDRTRYLALWAKTEE